LKTARTRPPRDASRTESEATRPRLISRLWGRRRALLRAALVAGALFALSIRPLVGALVPKLVDGLVSRRIGYHVAFDGLDFALGSMRFVAHDLTFTPLSGGPPIGRCSRAEARIDATRLLRGVSFESLDLDGLTIRATRLESGSLDVIETAAAAWRRRPPHRVPFHIERLQCRSVIVEVVEPPAVTSSSTTVTHMLSLDVFAQGLGSMRLGLPNAAPGDFTVVGWGRDLADRVSIVGRVSLGVRETRVNATVALAGADLGALAPPRIRAAGQPERVSVHVEAGLIVRELARRESELELTVADLSVFAGSERRASVRSAFARLRRRRGEEDAWREVRVHEPRVSLERSGDGSLTTAGLVVVGPSRAPAAPVQSETSAAILDRLEATSTSFIPSTRCRAAAHGTRRLPRLPDSFEIDHGELRIAGPEDGPRSERVVREISVVEHIQRGEGSAHVVAKVEAASPGVAESFRVAIDATLTNHEVAGAVQLSADGVAIAELAPLGSATDDLAAAGLRAGGRFKLERESRSRFSGELVLRDVRFGADDASLARLDAFTGAFSLELGRERPALHLSQVVVDGAFARLTRSSKGGLVLGGLVLAATGGRAVEPAIDLDVDRLELRRARLRLELCDRSPALTSEIGFDATFTGVAVGGEPGVATVTIEGAASGLCRHLSVRGSILTSRVCPAAILDVHADALRLARTSAPMGLAVAFDEATVEGRVAWALVRGPLGERDLTASVSSLVLADREGTGLSLDEGRVHVLFPGSPDAVVEIGGVDLLRPRATVEAGAQGVSIGRAFTWTPADPSEALPDPTGRPRAETSRVRLRGLRVVDGAIDVLQDARERREPVRVRGIEARAVRRDVAQGRGEPPLEVEVTAEIAGVASLLHVTASLERGTVLPRLHAEVDANGLDVDAVCALSSGLSSGSAIHAGSFHAGVDVSARRLLDASLAGEIALRDVSLEDDSKEVLLHLARGAIREISYQPRTGELFLGELDLDRPHVVVVRESSGELVVAGFDTGVKSRALLEATPPAPADAPEPPREPRPREDAPRKRSRIEIDHSSVGEISAVIEDRGARDARGKPPVWTVTNGDASAHRLVFGSEGFEALGAFFVELSLDGGANLLVDGSLGREERTLEGWATFALRDLDLGRVSPYTEVARHVRLERGTLTLEGALTATRGHVEGDARVSLRRPRLRRLSAPRPAVEGGSERGRREDRETVEELDRDGSIDVPFGGEVSDVRVQRGRLVGRWLGSALLDVLEQPLKMLRPVDDVTGSSLETWFLRKIRGPKAPLAGPITARAVFAPGSARLTDEGARAIATVAPYAAGTARLVTLRAVSGDSDRALAARAAQLTPQSARELFVRFGARRAALEDERRECAASERVSLERGDASGAEALRDRIIAIEEVLTRLERSLDDLGNRIVASGPALEKGRSDEALRELARERIEVVRAALVRAGVDPRRARVNLAHLSGPGGDYAPPGDGVVEIEVLP
jgi:hypothetical protein